MREPSYPVVGKANSAVVRLPNYSVSEPDLLRHLGTLEAEGLLYRHLPNKAPRTSSSSVAVDQPETTDFAPEKRVEEAPTLRARLDESIRPLTTTFLALVYYVLILPHRWMQRLWLPSGGLRVRRRESTWEPFHTHGLHDKGSYELPF